MICLKRFSAFRSLFDKGYNQPSAPPSESPTFPPIKSQVTLDELLSLGSGPPTHHRDGLWFEDANYFYYMAFDAGEPQLALAQEKNLCLADLHHSYAFIFDLAQLTFDGRFIFGQDTRSTLRFGHYSDNNLGRVFHLTEPKDAKQMLVSWRELTGAFDWLDGADSVAHFHHDSFSDFDLHVVIPVGSRFDEIEDRLIVSDDQASKDRQFYQRLFEEELKAFVGIPVEKTTFTSFIPEPTPEEIARIAQETADLAERQAKISQQLAATEEEFNAYLRPYLDEFHLAITLERENVHRLAVTIEEAKLKLHAPDGTVIYDYPISLDSFLHLSPETIVRDIASPTCQFLDRHRNKFHAFEKLYRANSSFHDLVRPSSRAPKLDYNLIFNQGRLILPH